MAPLTAADVFSAVPAVRADFASTAMIYSDELKRYIPDIPTQLAQAEARIANKIKVKDFAGYLATFRHTRTLMPMSPILSSSFHRF